MSMRTDSPAVQTVPHRVLLGRTVWRMCRQWLILAIVAVAAIVLGYIGLSEYFIAAGKPRSFWDICYFILYLFVVESGEVSGPVPWQLTVARFLAPVVPAWAIVKATAVIFRDRLDMLRLRFARGHVVICGLGQKGLDFVRDFRRHGERVVAVELDGESPTVRASRELGALVLLGDAKDVSLLHKARVHYARFVVAICDDDGANMEIAIHAHQLVQARSAMLRNVVKCFVHVFDLHLCEAFRQYRVFAETGDRLRAHIFNIHENSARLLLENHPLDRCRIQVDSQQEVRLVVIGFGWMGESVVLQAAKTAHFANGKKLRVLIVDLHSERLRQNFCNRYSRFDQVCTAEYVEGDTNDPEIVAQICSWASEPKALTTIVVCLDNESQCLSCALNLQSKLGDGQLPILARMTDHAGLATLLENGCGKKFCSSIKPFGMTGFTCTRRMLLDEELDVLARAIHHSYVEDQRKMGKPATDLSMRPWERLDHDLRESNRQQADHIPVKLRAIGCFSSPPALGQLPVTQFTEDEIELLARMEHARFNAERFLAGWNCGPKNVAKKTSPYLVAWDDLPAEIKDYDREAVRNIPHLMKTIGQTIHRCDSAP
jgi:hypothetical protein